MCWEHEGSLPSVERGPGHPCLSTRHLDLERRQRRKGVIYDPLRGEELKVGTVQSPRSRSDMNVSMTSGARSKAGGVGGRGSGCIVNAAVEGGTARLEL